MTFILSVYRQALGYLLPLFILMLLERKLYQIALSEGKKRFKDIKNKNHVVKHSGKINIQVILGMCQFICYSDPFLLSVDSECPYLLLFNKQEDRTGCAKTRCRAVIIDHYIPTK